MMKKVRAKFTCHYINEFEGEKTAFMNAVYDGEENKEWAAVTPGGNINITIGKDTPAKDFFEQGKAYYLDFSVAD